MPQVIRFAPFMPLLELVTSAPAPADKAAFISKITGALAASLGKPAEVCVVCVCVCVCVCVVSVPCISHRPQYCMVSLRFDADLALGGSTDPAGEWLVHACAHVFVSACACSWCSISGYCSPPQDLVHWEARRCGEQEAHNFLFRVCRG